jgi:anti-anti-sigma factor
MLSIEQHDQEGVQVVELVGEAGSAEAWEVGAVVSRLIEKHPDKLLFDLSRLSFISSLAFGELVRLANDIARYHSRVALAAMQPKIREVLHLLRIEQYYETYPTVEAAMAALRKSEA